MTTEVKLPQAGMGMTEGTIIKWLKAPNDNVIEDEILVEVEAAKATIEIPSPATGVVSKLLVEEGETVPVYTVIALIE